jgi:hypothetical protein
LIGLAVNILGLHTDSLCFECVFAFFDLRLFSAAGLSDNYRNSFTHPSLSGMATNVLYDSILAFGFGLKEGIKIS